MAGSRQVQVGEQLAGGEGTDALAGGKTPRGIRNNNPGNIEFGRFTKSYGATASDGRFAKFDTPEAGISAIYGLQRAYEGKGLTTVYQRISRWAPPNENNTTAYAQTVAAAMGIDMHTPFQIDDPKLGPAFVGAVIQHENGRNPYSPEQITTAQTLRGGGTQVAGGAPSAETVPLPRVSPTQRAMAQAAPPGTETVGSEAMPYFDPASAPVAPWDAVLTHPNAPVPNPPMNPRRDAAPAATAEAAAPALALEPESRPQEGLSVRVRPNDTLWDFAEQYLGDGRRWTEISKANQNISPERLVPGMVLNIPGVKGPPTPQGRPNQAEVKGAEPQGRPAAAPATLAPAAPRSPPAPAPAPATAIPAPAARPTPPSPAAPAPAPVPADQEFDAAEIDRLTMMDEQGNYLNQPGRRNPIIEAPPAAPAPAVVPPKPLEEVMKERSVDGVVHTTMTDAARQGAPKSTEPAQAPAARVAVQPPAGSSFSIARDEQKKRQMMENAMEPGSARVAAGTPEAPQPVESPWKSPLDNPISDWAVNTVFGPDSAFHGVMFDEPAAAATPPAPQLSLEPTKSQDRIDPSAPSQQQPATRQPSTVEAPKDMVNDAPLDPSVFRGGRNPPGLENVTIKPEGVAYRQNNWSVFSMGNGIASRTQMVNGQPTTQTWNPASSSWVTPPSSTPAPTVQPTQTAAATTKKPPVQATGNSGWMNSPGLSTQF